MEAPTRREFVKRMVHRLALAFLPSCVSKNGPSGRPWSRLTRAEIIKTAEAYRTHRWWARSVNVRHGVDGSGVRVDTPDIGYRKSGAVPGWWLPEAWNQGMPYQWGGFCTTESFDRGIERGLAAGDVYTLEKRRLLEAAVSNEAVGIDCSGFVSRCWGLNRSYSTRELASICVPLQSYEDLKPGDILNTYNAHCLLFGGWVDDQRERLWAYETGIPPHWKVIRHRPFVADLKQDGFVPLRYRGVMD